MLTDIAEDIGDLLDHELTPSAARIQVMINGLQPITKETIVEFSDRSEVLVTLDYKRLKSHCKHYLRLTHAEKNCPGLALIKGSPRDQGIPSASKSKSIQSSSNKTQQKETRDSVKSHYHPYSRHRSSHPENFNDRRKEYSNDSWKPSTNKRSPRRQSPPRDQNSYRGDSNRSLRSPVRHPARTSRDHLTSSLQWWEKSPPKEHRPPASPQSSRSRRPPLERSVDEPLLPTPIPIILSNEEVMGELCEVTL